jgi:hypothetical protein
MPLAFSSYSYVKQKDQTGDPWRVMMCIINEIVLRLVLEKNFIGSHAPSSDDEATDVAPELKGVKECHMVEQEIGCRVLLIPVVG